jgi:hypothetical protein
VNLILLPPELRPGWITRVALVIGGMFFIALAIVSTRQQLITSGWIAG